MSEEKTIHFSVLKQKIIKTDEVIKTYLEMSNKLKRAQQACKEIKLRYDDTTINYSRIQLEHERCSFHLENLKQRIDLLNIENRELREEKLLLEEHYNQHIVQSQLTIKNLEDELTLINELKSASTETLSPKKKRVAANICRGKINSEFNNQSDSNMIVDKTAFVETVQEKYSKTIKKLEEFNDVQLQSRVNEKEEHLSASENGSEDYFEISCLDSKQDITILKEPPDKPNKKVTQDFGIQTDPLKPEMNTVRTQTLETMKTLKLQDVVFAENKQLKGKLLECETELIKLKSKGKPRTKSFSTQTEDEFDSKYVKEILTEMSIPNLLSPLSPYVDENCSNVGNDAIPEIVVTPPTPMIEKGIEPIMNFEVDAKDTENQKNSSAQDNEEFRRTVPRKNKYRSPIISNDFINLRRNSLRKLINKKNVLNKEIRKIRRVRRQDYLLKTLYALKHADINFTITNNSATTNRTRKNCILSKENAEKSYTTGQLNCTCKNCNQSCTLSSGIQERSHLFDFCNIKSEVSTPTDSIRNRGDNNSTETTTGNILETIAQMVIKRLDGRDKNTSKRKRNTSSQSDTFASETETEIERLFDKSDEDILKRNKMLLETAKQQNHTNMSTPTLDENNEIQETENILNISLLNENLEDCLNSISEDFTLPLLSPIKSVKGLEILERDDNNSSRQEQNDEHSTKTYQKHKNCPLSDTVIEDPVQINVELDNPQIEASLKDHVDYICHKFVPSQVPPENRETTPISPKSSVKDSAAIESDKAADSVSIKQFPPKDRDENSLSLDDDLLSNNSEDLIEEMEFVGIPSCPQSPNEDFNTDVKSPKFNPLETLDKEESEETDADLISSISDVDIDDLSVAVQSKHILEENDGLNAFQNTNIESLVDPEESMEGFTFTECPLLLSPIKSLEDTIDEGEETNNSLNHEQKRISGADSATRTNIVSEKPEGDCANSENNHAKEESSNSLPGFKTWKQIDQTNPRVHIQHNTEDPFYLAQLSSQTNGTKAKLSKTVEEILATIKSDELETDSCNIIESSVPYVVSSIASKDNQQTNNTTVISKGSSQEVNVAEKKEFEDLCCSETSLTNKYSDRQFLGEEEFADIPSCPESPLLDDFDEEAKSPIHIPLEKINGLVEMQEVGKTNKPEGTFNQICQNSDSIGEVSKEFDKPQEVCTNSKNNAKEETTKSFPQYKTSLQDHIKNNFHKLNLFQFPLQKAQPKPAISTEPPKSAEGNIAVVKSDTLLENDSIAKRSTHPVSSTNNHQSSTISGSREIFVTDLPLCPDPTKDDCDPIVKSPKHTPSVSKLDRHEESIKTDAALSSTMLESKVENLTPTTRARRRSKRILEKNGLETTQSTSVENLVAFEEEQTSPKRPGKKPKTCSRNIANESLEHEQVILIKNEKTTSQKCQRFLYALPGKDVEKSSNSPPSPFIIEDLCKRNIVSDNSDVSKNESSTDNCSIIQESSSSLAKSEAETDLDYENSQYRIRHNFKLNLFQDVTKINSSISSDKDIPSTIEFIENQETKTMGLTDSSSSNNTLKLHVKEGNRFEDIPSCPESPVANNANAEVSSPIVIPLEKLYSQEKCERSNDEVSTFAVLKSNDKKDLSFESSTVLRRSKRISQKISPNVPKRKCCKTSVTDLKTNNEGGISVEQHLNNVHSMKTKEELNKPLCEKPVEKLERIELQNENPTSDRISERRNQTITAKPKPRKSMSKLKSKVLQQVKHKSLMFGLNTECTLFKTDKDKVKIKDPKPTSTDKIHIVQNILIKANSNDVIDLMKDAFDKNSETAKNNCDIRLGNVQNTSQCKSTAVSISSCSKNKINDNDNTNTTPKKRKAVTEMDRDVLAVTNSSCNDTVSDNSGTSNPIPTKKRKVAPKRDCDVLSMIMDEMNKTGPKIVPKKVVESSSPKETVPDSTNEKHWRKGILVVADNVLNATSKPQVPEEHGVNSHAVFNPNPKLTLKRKVLLRRLFKISTEEVIPNEIILEFKRQDVDSIAEIILQKVSQDIHDKPTDKYYPAPLMTKTQRILLELMARLEKEHTENVMDTFLSKAEAFLFKRGCGIRPLIPITRLYMAVCKLRSDIDRMRDFCTNAFLFISDLAVPLYFAVLTSWTEVLPMEPCLNSYPLAKILIQTVHLKNCSRPGYNLHPLKMLFHQFYGYPLERWNCDELYTDTLHRYLRNPDKSSEKALKLLFKNKDTKWVHQKLNESLKPLIYKIPAENVNFKAQVIILIGKLCKHFKPNKEFDETYINDLKRWLVGLTEDEGVPDLIVRSVDLSISLLPKKKKIIKKPKITITPNVIRQQKKKKNRNIKCKNKNNQTPAAVI